VSDLEDGTVSRINPALNRVVDTIDVGGPAAAVSVDERTGQVWVYVI